MQTPAKESSLKKRNLNLLSIQMWPQLRNSSLSNTTWSSTFFTANIDVHDPKVEDDLLEKQKCVFAYSELPERIQRGLEHAGRGRRESEGTGCLLWCGSVGPGAQWMMEKAGEIRGSQGPHAASISSFTTRLFTGCTLSLGDWKNPILMAPVLAPESVLYQWSSIPVV